MPKIQIRRDTSANWKSVNPTLLSGEWALETDTKKMKIGDGSTAYNFLPYSTVEEEQWVKPADWIDIRSGALPNSIYFLVGHSADYATYPAFGINATISNSGTYDVYIDGIKQTTTASGSDTTLNWQTLALTSGYDVTYPSALRTHIVRVTPTDSANTITALKQNGMSSMASGLLWVHFAISNAINLDNFSRGGGVSFCNIWEAITADGNILKVATSIQNFARSVSLKTVPILDGNNQTINVNSTFGSNANDSCILLKKIHFKNLNGTGNNTFASCSSLKEIICENTSFDLEGNPFDNCRSLEKLPSLLFGSSNEGTANSFLLRCVNLKDTFIDASSGASVKKIDFGGNSSYVLNGVKGLTVSPSAPFSHATGPQLDVSYTGMDRAALINLFKSMPYNVGYTVVGSPTITAGVASGFSTSDYVKSESAFVDAAGNLEICVAFNASTTNNQPIFGVVDNYNPQRPFLALASSKIQFQIANNVSLTTTTTISANTNYKVILTRNASVYTLKLYSGDTLLDTQTLSSETLIGNGISNTFAFGYDKSMYADKFNGSIDLNNTYIKVNGVPWFRGTAAMTKTCDVRGCTGTADLTADDKAIATGKGWSLTVA